MPIIPVRDDREAVLAAVKIDGCSIAHASHRLRGDREVVLAAVKHDGGEICYAEGGLKADREVVLAAVEQNGLMLEFAEGGLEQQCVQEREREPSFGHSECTLNM